MSEFEINKTTIYNTDLNFEHEPEQALPIPELSTIKTCVVAISSDMPYDTSKFVNNETTFYKRINYLELGELFNSINDDISNSTLISKQVFNQNIIFISDCYKQPEIKMIFRFLCSSDCDNGEQFIDKTNTNLVYKFVKFVCTRPECLVEFSDHSLGAFVKNWDNDIMSMNCPISIKTYTHSGKFKMTGKKSNFINSTHPTLKQIGDMAETEDIVITFDNMGGTKVYEILDNDILRLISTGNQENPTHDHNIYSFFNKSRMFNDDNQEIYSSVPVHTEFDYNKGKIILSSTHWCNLDSVETPINIPKLRRYCTDSLGMQATQELDQMLSSVLNENECRRIISATVRQISSGNKG
jgi:hypothetical protein